jgi:integrase
MSNNTVNASLRRIGCTGEQMTAHGFRATVRTLLAELGWQPDTIERQLAHKASGPLGAAYDRAQFLAERRKMMQARADYLDGLRNGAKVVRIKRDVGNRQ